MRIAREFALYAASAAALISAAYWLRFDTMIWI